MKKFVLLVFIFILGMHYSQAQEKTNLNYKLHTFYYNWYGNPEKDGKYYHWAHDVLPHWSDTTWNHMPPFTGGNDIGANFYPKLGCYSSNDTSLIEKHMEMIAKAGIGVVVITWWGKDSYEDKSIPLYLKIADKHGIKITFHIEPFYETIKEFRESVCYLIDKYGKYPAFYKQNDKPFFYIYDSYKIKAIDWATVLGTKGSSSLRKTKYDATFIGLWVNKGEEDFFNNGNFDGIYTYFASNGFTDGSNVDSWTFLNVWAGFNNKIFIPCVGPGYNDTRIRPWNSKNTKSRNAGKYYDMMFGAAVNLHPKFIGITSFNEWHEGTQIEPAVPKKDGGYKYEDFSPLSPNYYINRTFMWSKKFNN
jgi:glycoprotein endo-alpha-1,2-mannosidase